MNQKEDQRIGLCISGGGSKGMAAIAIIEKMLEQGVNFSAISGTSVGAIIGAYLAKNGEVTTLKENLLSMGSLEWLRLLDPVITKRKALIRGAKFRRIYNDMFGETKFSDLLVPLVVPVTDLQEGKAKYINSGSVLDAVTASSAYPGVFPPHYINGKPYSDGGILDNLPYQALVKLDLDKIVVINLLNISSSATEDAYSSVSAIISRSLDLLMANTFKLESDYEKNIFLFNPELSGNVVAPFRLSRLSRYYEDGLKEYKRNEKEFLEWL